MRASDASDDGCDSGNAGRAETASDDPSPIPHALRVLDDSAGDMLAKLSDASIGAEELVHALIERRRMLGDELNAIVTTCDDEALATARGIDSRRTPGIEHRSLAGLPITVKDGIHVAGLPSTGGMLQPAQAIAREDALTVSRLRQAGAIVVGKTNVPVGNGDWQASNPIFGRTKNPWNPALTPGGSTGGGAAAGAAGLSAAEIGSDIGGSIRIPAAFCGLFGHKPSLSAVPRSGHFPRAGVPNPGQVLGVQGPLARSARDLKMLFDVLRGPETTEEKGWRLELPAPRSTTFDGCRIGLLRLPDWMPVDDEILTVQEEICDLLAARGAVLRSIDPQEFIGGLEDYYCQYLSLLQGLIAGEISAPARARAAVKMRSYSDRFLDAVADGLEAGTGTFLNLLETTEQRRSQWERVFHEVDVLLSPVCNTNAFPHDDSYFYERRLQVGGRSMPYYRLSAIPALASLAGLPVTVFPTQRRTNRGAPIGLQFTGAYLEDYTTLRCAELMEAEIGGFQAPPILASGDASA